MATGCAGDNAVSEQIEATIEDGVARAREDLSKGFSRERFEDYEAPIPEAPHRAVTGVRLCVACQQAHDAEQPTFAGYNRYGSTDSALR